MKFNLPKVLLVAILCLIGISGMNAQSIQYSTKCANYSQTFDTLITSGSITTGTSTSTPYHLNTNAYGWYTGRSSGTNTSGILQANAGGTTNGGHYSYGTGTNADRALGTIASGTNIPTFGVRFKNTTGITLTQITVSIDAEMWRRGSAAANVLSFSYKIASNPNVLDASGFTSVTNLDATSPSTAGSDVARDGNSSTYRTAAILYTITGLSWANGDVICLRWSDVNDSGNDDGVAIDNFSFSASDGCCAPSSGPSGLTFSGVLNDQMSLNFTGGTGGTRLIVAKVGSSPSGTPVNGTTYTANSTFTSCPACTLGTGEKIIYNGTGTSVFVNGLSASTNYYYKVYEYSCTGSNSIFNSTPASGNQTTLSSCPAPTIGSSNAFYTQINKTSAKINWTVGNGVRRIVVLSTSSGVVAPTNNTTYTANANYTSGSNISGASYVVYDGTGNNVTVTGLSANTTYYLRVIEYNCSPGSQKYVSNLSLFGSLRTAGAFTPGNITALRVGYGVYSSTGTEVFVDEIGKFTKTVKQSISLPSSGTNKLIISQSATSEGSMSISGDGKLLVMAGYDLTDPNGTGVSSAASSVNRSVGYVDITGTSAVASKTNNGFNTNNIRSGATQNGTGFYMAGASGDLTGGVRYITSGAYNSTSVQIQSTVDNCGSTFIYDNQLYLTSNSGNKLSTVGTGLPTTSGQTISAVSSVITSAITSAGPAVFIDATETTSGAELLYMADQGTARDEAGVYKFSKAAGVWTARGKVKLNDTSTTSLGSQRIIGLSAKQLQNGNVEIFITMDRGTTGDDNSAIVKWIDSSSYTTNIGTTRAFISSSATNRVGTVIARSAPKTKWRGIQYAPIENLTINSTTSIPAGTYNNITIGAGGNATLTGDIIVYGNIRVKALGKLDLSTYKVNGWGPGYRTVFQVADSGYVKTANAKGFTKDVITMSEFNFSRNAVYEFNATAGITGAALPDTLSTILINTSGTINLTKNQVIMDLVQVDNGTLITNPSKLTLTSKSTNTARIGKLCSTCKITGYVYHQRYIGGTTADTGWTYLSMPVKNNLSEWSNDIAMSVLTVYRYNESLTGNLNNGWTKPTSIGQNTDSGRGWNIYVPTKPALLTARGTIYKGTFNAPVTYTNTGSATNDGWNLVGNPYCSDINWSNGGVTKTNIDSTIYIWKESTGVYATWNGTTGTNGGSKYIANAQSVFVHANAASPSIQFSENAKYIVPAATFISKKEISGLVRINLIDNNGKKDEAIVQFNNNATSNFDANIDGFKLNGNNENLSSVIDGNINLAYNALPLKEGRNIIPLNVEAKTGNHSFEISKSDISGTEVYLNDKENNSFTKITDVLVYPFNIANVTETKNRFQLVVVNKSSLIDANGNINLNNLVKVYPNPVQNQLNIETLADMPLNVTITDVTGRTIYSSNVSGSKVNTLNFEYPIGVYNVKVSNTNSSINFKVIKQ